MLTLVEVSKNGFGLKNPAGLKIFFTLNVVAHQMRPSALSHGWLLIDTM